MNDLSAPLSTVFRGAPRRLRATVFLSLAAVLAFGAAGAARAASVGGLYTASTPVQNQSAAIRDQAFSRDLAAVFVKVSGNPDAAQVAALSQVLQNPGKLIVEYRYRKAPASAGGGLELRARFDPKAVDEALAGAGQAIWGRDRPTVIAWVLTPSGILSDDPGSPVAVAMRQDAKARGLPFVLPLMDLTDRQKVSAFDIRTRFLSALRSASKRYDAQAFLIGNVTYTDGGVDSRWTLAFGNSKAPFELTAASPQAAASKGVGRAATLLAQQLAYQPGSGASGALLLVVDGIGSLRDEVKVERIAAGVQGVSGVSLAGVSGHTVRYRVDYSGVPADFGRALALSGSLSQAARPVLASPGSSAAAPVSNLPELRFHYGP